MIAAVAFVFGLIGSLFMTEANVYARLLTALAVAATAFIAALFLAGLDYVQHTGAVRRVRAKLLARGDSSDEEFVALFPQHEPTLVQQTRRAIAQFFDVPVEKIRATDSLNGDLEYSTLEPGFHTFVVYHVLEARKVNPQPFSFKATLNDIGELIAEIQRVLDDMSSANH
jgi:hypothetical protein